MKKLLLLSLVLISFSSSTTAITMIDRHESEVIFIEDMIVDSGIDRNVTSIVEASIDYDMQHVEFVFNKSVGNVNIVIINDMGQTVGGATCNTSLESIKHISVPTDVGSYTITILGNDYEGEGHYNIISDSFEF